MSGAVVFETMRVRGGRIPLVGAHLERLQRGAATVGLPSVPDAVAAEAVARVGQGGERILRLAWSVAGARWSERSVEGPAVWRLLTVAEPHPGYAVKTEERRAFDRALAAAREAGADEPLLSTATDTMVEAARFAVVWIEGDDLCYPDPALGGLPSVGLGRLLAVAGPAGVGTRAARVSASGLYGLPMGLVNAARGLVSVETLDGRPVPTHDTLGDLAERFWPLA